jgi:cytochrome P450
VQIAEELPLAVLPMGDSSFAQDPAAGFAAARLKHPWLAKWAYGYVVTEYKAMRDLFRMEDRMRTGFRALVELMGAEGTAWGRFQQSHLTGSSGDYHNRLRDILAFAFTPRQANLHRGLMRDVIATLLDEWVPRGAFDFGEFASWFPTTVMCSLIGASPNVIPSILSSMEVLGMSVSMDKSLLPGMQKAIEVLDEFVHRLMTERRRAPGSTSASDLLDVLLQAQDLGGLSNRELADLLILLFAAGYDTTKNQLTLTMYELLQRPQMYRRCGEDRTFCRKIVEESLRYHGIVSTSRLLNEDIIYRDIRLAKDAMIWFPVNMAGRDPSAFDDADQFQPESDRTQAHISFGLGPHICLGQFLARALLEEGLHLIAQRITNPRSQGPIAWRPFPGVWGIGGLPVEFEPG